MSEGQMAVGDRRPAEGLADKLLLVSDLVASFLANGLSLAYLPPLFVSINLRTLQFNFYFLLARLLLLLDSPLLRFAPLSLCWFRVAVLCLELIKMMSLELCTFFVVTG